MKSLTTFKINVVLIIDKIHTAPRVKYPHGQLSGLDGGEITKTILSFMIKSCGGKYCDVVALCPITKLSSSIIKGFYNSVTEMLKKVGFCVVGISVDNFSANRKFYKHELCGGQLQPSITDKVDDQETFLLIDSMHNFKNIYNVFMRKKHIECPDFMNEIIGNPTFKHIEKVYNIELGKPAKIAYKLTEKALHPTAIEKTNVQLANSVFHESTITALTFYGENGYPELLETVPFLKLMHKFWNIVNVKNPTIGAKMRDETQNPIRDPQDENITFLHNIASWFETWRSSGKEGLTRETFQAVIQTSRALVGLTPHLLINKKFGYILLGQLQSDPLEGRFGWYRQLCGSIYFVSVRQVLEAEKSIRVKLLVKYSGLKMCNIKEVFSPGENEEKKEIDEESKVLVDLVNDPFEDLSESIEDSPLLFYISGYVARSITRQGGCSKCKSLLMKSSESPTIEFDSDTLLSQDLESERSRFLEQVNRGGLVTPSDATFVACLHAWQFFKSILTDSEAKAHLLTTKKPQNVFICALEQIVTEDMNSACLMELSCESSHSFMKLCHQIWFKMFNIMMKNFVSDVNSAARTQGKRSSHNLASGSRKIRKLQSQN